MAYARNPELEALSQEQLAEMAIINVMYLYSIEGTGKVNLSVDLLVALAVRLLPAAKEHGRSGSSPQSGAVTPHEPPSGASLATSTKR